MTKTKSFLAGFAVFALLLFCSAPADAATAPKLDSLEVIGSDSVTYLDEDDFSASIYSYDIELDEDVDYLRVYADPKDSDDEVTVTYSEGTVSERSGYWRVPVKTDDLGIITVTVKDDASSSNKSTYKIDLSSDTDEGQELLGLYVNEGDSYDPSKSSRIDMYPEYTEGVRDYTVLVPYRSTTDLNMRINVSSNSVKMYVGAPRVTPTNKSYDHQINITNSFWGTTKVVNLRINGEKYSVTFIYAPDDADDDCGLKDLAIRSKVSNSSSNDLTLSPKFHTLEEDYTLDLSKSSYSKLYLYPEAGKDMTVLINDQLMEEDDDYWEFDPQKVDEIVIMVFAQDLDEYMEYNIDLNTGAAKADQLSSLTVYTAASLSVGFSPAFSPSVYNYTAQVDNSVTAINLNAASSADVLISQNSGAYVDGNRTVAFELNTGLNTFDIKVGASTYYHLNIYRNAAYNSIVASPQYLSLDNGTAQRIAAFNINGNNFVKLRDVAYLLNGTAKQFSVSYNKQTNGVTLVSGQPYAKVGGEMTAPSSYKNIGPTKQTVMLNGALIAPTAYNIDGNNYFLLRDVAALFNFGIDFKNSVVNIYTDRGYGDEAAAPDVTAGDFSDVGLRLKGEEGGSYIANADFKVDQLTYSVYVDSDEDELTLHVYYDEDHYSVSVKYDDGSAGVSKGDYRTGYGYAVYTVDIGNDLKNITVTFKNDENKKLTYTLKLK